MYKHDYATVNSTFMNVYRAPIKKQNKNKRKNSKSRGRAGKREKVEY